MEQIHYPTILGANEKAMARLFGSCDTFRYTDYAKHDCNLFDAEKKAVQRDTQFPVDLEKALDKESFRGQGLSFCGSVLF